MNWYTRASGLLSTASRAAPALDGLEIVQLCLYAELPLSAVMDAEEGQ